MKIYEKIALNYIKNNMSHERHYNRDKIFQTINNVMNDIFTEDNVQTKVYCLVKWLIQNNEEFKELYNKYGDDYLNAIAECAKDGVLEFKEDKWITLKLLPSGSLFETKNGIKAIKSEYYYQNGQCKCILLNSGEYAHFEEGNNTKVKIISI